jgi:hypothetical protein
MSTRRPRSAGVGSSSTIAVIVWYRTPGPSTCRCRGVVGYTAVGSVRRDEVESTFAACAPYRYGTPILEHRGDPGAVVLLERHQLHSKLYVISTEFPRPVPE